MKEKIIELRAQGKTYSQIQNEVGCSQSTISYHLNDFSKEKAAIRSKRQIRKKCNCGNFVAKDLLICKNCINKEVRQTKRQKIYDSSICEYYKNYSSNTKHTSIRRLARVFMEETSVEKICKICEFSDYVELCHIKPIHKFNCEDKISEVNSLDNLVYLCPNHHKLLDIGKIQV